MLLSLLSSFLGVAAFSSSALSILGLFFLAPYFLFLAKESSLWKLLIGSLIFRLIFNLGNAYFIFEPIMFLISTLIFLSLPLSIYFFKKFWPKMPPNYLFFIIPFFFAFWDLVCATTSIFPSYIIAAGNALASTPFLGLAGIGGIITLTFFSSLTASLLAGTIYFLRDKKMFWVFPVLMITIIALGFFFSQYFLEKNNRDYQARAGSLKFAALSSDGRLDTIFRNDVFKGDFDARNAERARSLINQVTDQIKNEVSNKKIEALFLPEDLVDSELWGNADNEAKQKFGITNNGLLIEAYRSLAKDLSTNVVATITTIQDGKRYKGTLVFTKEGQISDIYHKNRLTITGEYWPFQGWRPFYYDWFVKISPIIAKYSPVYDVRYEYQTDGKIRPLTLDDNLKFGSRICLESHYPEDNQKMKDVGSKFLFINSNNAWNDSGLNEFLYLNNNFKKIESVRLNLSMINSGVRDYAGFFTPDGKNNLIGFNVETGRAIFFGEIKI